MKRFFIIFLGILFGCSTIWDINDIETRENKGNLFDRTLKEEYINLAKVAKENGDWQNLRIFLQRARWASDGETMNIEPLGARKINTEVKTIMENAYQRLDIAFSHGAKIKSQKNSAIAQGSYECMSYFAEDTIIDDDFTKCRDNFEKAMDFFENINEKNDIDMEQENIFLKKDMVILPKVEGMGKDIWQILEERLEETGNNEDSNDKNVDSSYEKIEILRESVMVLPEKMADIPKYLIYFDFNKSNIKDEYRNIIDDMANNYKIIMPKTVEINGHTDTKGLKRVNMIISKRRAKVVANALMKKGVPESIMKVKGYGENNLAVQTKDGVINAKNRRTEIEFK